MTKPYLNIYLNHAVLEALAILHAREPERSRSALVQQAIIAAAATSTTTGEGKSR